MILYYLTEMNLVKLENVLLKFILKNKINKQLQNGIISKISQMMYNKHIDYYYPDYIATNIDIDIKHVDQVYLYGCHDIYEKSLEELLKACSIYTGKTGEADCLEKQVNKILLTKKPILTRKYKR